MGQSYHALWVHFIWGTKYRQPLILPEWKFKLYDQFRNISNDKGYYLDYINGVEDHVHLLMGLKSTHTVATMAKDLKGISQTWVRINDLSHEYFQWQDGYAAISVSPKQVPSVRRYIKNQEQHHKKNTFEEEWNEFKKHAVIV